MDRQRKKQGKKDMQIITIRKSNLSHKVHEQAKHNLKENRVREGKSTQVTTLKSNAWGGRFNYKFGGKRATQKHHSSKKELIGERIVICCEVIIFLRPVTGQRLFIALPAQHSRSLVLWSARAAALSAIHIPFLMQAST